MTRREQFTRWLDIITYGDGRKYAKFISWLFFDSFVASIPSSVLMVAVYLLLAPILDSTQVYTQKPLWILVGILLAQTIAYAIVRRKSYLDICVGHVSAQQEEKLRTGDKLRALPMGYFATHDAGELSTLLMRNYEEIENLSSSIAANGTVILIRLLIALIVLGIFDVRMMLAMFIVIPLAVPFAYSRSDRHSAENRCKRHRIRRRHHDLAGISSRRKRICRTERELRQIARRLQTAGKSRRCHFDVRQVDPVSGHQHRHGVRRVSAFDR